MYPYIAAYLLIGAVIGLLPTLLLILETRKMPLQFIWIAVCLLLYSCVFWPSIVILFFADTEDKYEKETP